MMICPNELCKASLWDNAEYCPFCAWAKSIPAPLTTPEKPPPKALRAACDACMAMDPQQKHPWTTMLKRPDPTTIQVFFLCPAHPLESLWPKDTTPRYQLPVGPYATHYR